MKNYKATIADEKNIDLKFDGLVGSEDKDKLQEKCEEALNKSSNNDYSYKKAKKWCTSPKKLKEILNHLNYTTLSNDSSRDDNQTEWDAKLTSYDSDQSRENKFSGLNLKVSGNLTKNAETRNKLKAECKKLDEKNIMKRILKQN